MERIEDRLLLSVAGGSSVSEGGTVALDGGLLATGGWTSPASSYVTFSGAGEFNGGGYRRDDGVYGASGKAASPFEMHPQAEIGSSDGMLFEPATAGPTGPKNIDLVQEDLAPLPPEQGMVDLARVAYDEVFAEIGAVASTSEMNGVITLTPGGESDATNLLPNRQIAGRDLPGDSVKSLSGSRGRLAAFGLAMQQQITFDWRDGLDDANRRVPDSGAPEATAGAGAARLNRAALDAFSGLQPDPMKYPVGPGDAIADPAPVGRPAVSSPVLAGTFPALRPATPAQPAAARLAPAPQDETPAGNVVTASAVSLDRSREETATHLAFVLGIGQVMLRQRTQSADSPEHEQLPPRKR